MDQKDWQKFKNVSSPLLITGETGTGKSRLAKEIFNHSSINKEKFLTAHLASLKEDLLESELFGHLRGAFTGALEAKNGYLKEVGCGTLFLDEVGELSLEAQKKLLYLLEEKKFTPLGSAMALEFKGRIIMATNRPLARMVEEGTFREDLYYRIKIFELKLPSLRSRPHFLRDVIERHFGEMKNNFHKHHLMLSEEAKKFLEEREWKGNVREVRNVLEYAVVMAEGRMVNPCHFPRDGFEKEVSKASFISQFPDDFNQSLEIFEKMYLEEQFKKNSGRVNETARKLGMSKTTLIHKAKKYQINTLKIRADAVPKAA